MFYDGTKDKTCQVEISPATIVHVSTFFVVVNKMQTWTSYANANATEGYKRTTFINISCVLSVQKCC